MNKQTAIDIFALTDCHQEARKLCILFSGIIARANKNGAGALICDSGDLFKGIYDRELCVENYLELRRQLPEAKIVMALGNNDFGFNSDHLNFLEQTARRFNQANIHVLCANLHDLNSGTCPKWVDPYILLEIGGKKVMVTAFCVNYIRLQRYNLVLEDIVETFTGMAETIKHIEPDALIILNHALRTNSAEIWQAAQKCGIRVDLIVGGHEHSTVEPKPSERTYYPQAFSRTMLHFKMDFAPHATDLKLLEIVSSKTEPLHPIFAAPLDEYERKAGLNIPVAKSTLNLTRNYSDACPLGSFVADQMRAAAKADLAVLSTGYLTHALRYEKDKILTMYNLERVFSAETPVQTIVLSPKTLKAVLNNAVRFRYLQVYGNTRFLQCSSNLGIVCAKNAENFGEVKQIMINNEPILDDDGNPLHPEDEYLCALDPFVASGELGFDMLRAVAKETLIKNNHLVRIKDLILHAIESAEYIYPEGSTYPQTKIIDI
ncbi:MAG: 5'-nucleotidase C-terminal domain-containing protein [Alphaproteobacteria bacterium]|nr:5'-nucleotidase C-terminal domain-containing protein [Alphaproteobacteria bacterium]